MRAVGLSRVVVGLVLALASSALAGEGSGSDRGERIAAFWSHFFSAPTAPRVGVGANVGWLMWERAYGGFGPRGVAGISGRYYLGPWLTLGGRFDYSGYSDGTASLQYQNRRYGFAGLAGVGHWLGRFRVEGGASLGASLGTLAINDAGQKRSASRFKPELGAYAAGGVGILGMGLLDLEVGARYHPGRIDPFVVFALEYTFE